MASTTQDLGVPLKHGFGRYCPWCWNHIEPSRRSDECNLIITQPSGRAGDVPVPLWAVLDHGFANLLASGALRPNTTTTTTMLSLNDPTIVQWAGNRIVADEYDMARL